MGSGTRGASRWIALAIVVATSGAASAGGYITEGFGASAYRGGLAPYDAGVLRGRIGVGLAIDDWAFEILGTFDIPTDVAVDCGDSACRTIGPPGAGITMAGLDLRRRWELAHLRAWRTLRSDFALHGGLRHASGDDALAGFIGVGVGGGATFEVSARAIGVYLDVGTDVVWMGRGDENLVGQTPYAMVGTRFGWF